MSEQSFVRVEHARQSGLGAVLSVPVIAGGQVVTVLVLFMAEPRADDERLVELVSSVAAQLGSVIQRKRAERETQRVAADLMQLIDTANAPIFGIDKQGLVNEWNQTAVRITGYGKEEVLGRDLVEDFITDDYKEPVKKVLDRASMGQETENYEFPLYTKDGQRVMVLLNATTRRDAAGNIVGVVGVGQDITELDAYRAEMERVATELTQLIDMANAPIFGIDKQGLVNEWNQTAVRITGYGKEEVLGRDLVEDFITDDYKEPVKKVLDRASMGQETENYEFPLYTKDGQRVMVLLNATTRRDAAGNIVGVVGVGQDITELDAYRTEMENLVKTRTLKLEQALSELRETNQLKTEFLSTAAHELRTPLTSIRGFSEIMLTRQLAKERQTRFMTMINDQATHLAQIIDDLLDISRLEAGRGMEIAPEPINMAGLMTEVVSPLVEANPNHQFRIEGLREHPLLMGDPFRLGQVGKNIISNAVKYSPAGGTITIRSRVIDEFLEISVQDEGLGMTPEQQKHLFEKFYRADASNTAIGGTGLGLAISQLIIELHGGKIWAESESGVGSTFFIRLPLLP